MLDFLLSFLLLYKYALLSAVVFAASVGFPVPATAVLMASGAFAAQGYFDFPTIAAVAFVSSVSGDLSGYLLTRRYGRGLIVRFGGGEWLSSSRYLALETTFSKHSAWVIFSSRFIATSVGPAVNVVAGLSNTPYRTFLPAGIAGEFLYAFAFAGLGYAFSDHWEYVSKISGDVMGLSAVALLFAFSIAILLRAKRIRNFRFRGFLERLRFVRK